ncbi:TonB-dependent receptor [Bacteroides sp. Marseille-P3684]|uniref:SusC/RagA family TonB-linked outer membrane protein n=1 Tax=Bacteroides sp. Marseille-P3684 TaxID=2086579 RepID=UPI000D0F2697|nr:TonB-dependent receptor [Bacteroides sp. Marseille-P3684]
MNRIIHFLIVWCCVAGLVMAQNHRRELRGVVVDTNGEAVIGANISVKGTKLGTITDFDGAFTLQLPDSVRALQVTYIGFQSQTVAVTPGQTSLRVVLQNDLRQLDEVVVVGYGTQKKTSLTSSVEMVKADDLLQMGTVNLDEALSGQAAGLQVMSTTGDPSSRKEASIHIRGINKAPLLVIDGVPRFGTNTSDGEMLLSDLNPDDIESISILKDAAAAAVYGARAANGVILVQTKRAAGKPQKVSVNYRGQFNLQQATKLPHFLDAYEFAKLYNRAVANTPSTPYEAYTDEELEMIRTHAAPNKFGDENLLDYLDDYGYSMIHSLSVSGGNDAVRYYLSGGYTDTRGLYSGIGRDRYNYSMKLDATLLKGLTLSLDVTGSRSQNKNTSYTTLEAAYSYSPVQVLRFTNGQLASIEGGNPLIAVDGLGGYVEDKFNMSTITATLRYEIPWVKGLSAYLRGTFDNNSIINKTFDKPVTLYLYDENEDTFKEDSKTTYPKAKISLEQTDRFVDNKLVELGINYNRTFAEMHDVSALLILNYQDYKNRYMSGTNLDMPGIYPETIGTAVSAKLSGDEYYNERASMIGRLTYGYGNRYFVEGSFRVDGSTKFHPDHRWGFFPTVSASWVLSNEPFFKAWQQRVLSNVKFRASLGILGDDGSIADYAYLLNYMYTTQQGYNIGGNMKPGIVMSTGNYPNPKLEWGKSRDYNLGIDLGFWDNRISLSYEYYWRYNTNMITSAPAYLYPPSTGVEGNVPSMNFGKVKAWGWDLTLTHLNTIGAWKYNAALRLSKTDDVVKDYGDESSVDPLRRRVGKSSLVWWMYEADGLFQTEEEIKNHPLDQDGKKNATLAPGDIRYKDQNGDNELTDLDKIAVKNSSMPDMTMSLRLGVEYKGFFINATIQGVSGYKQDISDLYTLENNSLQRFQDYHLTDTWNEDNRDAHYPRIKFANKNDNNRKASTFWLQSCNFVRLKALSVGYSIPRHLLSRVKLSSASIALQGSNLHTWSSLENMDPETLRGYPVQRSYGVTLNLGF